MNYHKTCHGTTYLDENDLEEAGTNHEIKLAYYETKEKINNNLIYGIEIQKKEYIKDDVICESNKVKHISSNSDKVINIIKTLKHYKVTPIGLNDVLEDLLKLI